MMVSMPPSPLNVEFPVGAVNASAADVPFGIQGLPRCWRANDGSPSPWTPPQAISRNVVEGFEGTGVGLAIRSPIHANEAAAMIVPGCGSSSLLGASVRVPSGTAHFG
jgi:hypothetical protein